MCLSWLARPDTNTLLMCFPFKIYLPNDSSLSTFAFEHEAFLNLGPSCSVPSPAFILVTVLKCGVFPGMVAQPGKAELCEHLGD